MLEAAAWALFGASSLVAGALLGVFAPLPRAWVALLMAFGAGALVSSLAFDLTEEAFAAGGPLVVAGGLAAGGLTFFTGDQLIHRAGGARRGIRMREAQGNGPAIVLGALLDGIPESIVLGSTLLAGGAISVPFLAAVFVSNVPESVSATVDLRAEGHRPGWIIGLWAGVSVISALAAGLGYGLLQAMGGSVLVSLVQAFAAGAILTMLVDTLIPEAYDAGGDRVGLATVLGFAAAFLLSRVG